jgi:argininosuccinate lyase
MLDRAAEETIGITLSLDDDFIRTALDPVGFINSRVTEGSVNPKEVRKMLENARGKLESEKTWLCEQTELISGALNKLDDAIEAIENRRT